MAAPTLDGSATGTHSGASTNSATLTTSNANDIIIVLAYCEQSTAAPTVTSVTGGGLTFTKRKALAFNTSGLEIWWAHATSALSATAITANYSANFDDASMIVFGVSGCNTSSPWDGNASIPATYTSAAAATPSFTGISTNSPDDFLIFGWGSVWSGTSTAVPTGFTNIATSQNFGGSRFSSAGVAYEGVTAKQSSATFTWGGTVGGGDDVAIFDALTADSPGITLRGAGAGANGSGASATPSLPTGIAAGDVSILSAVGSTGTTVFTPPAGWTTIVNTTDFLLCWRAWQSGDTNPTVTATGQSWSSYEIITYSGCDTAAPIDQANWCFQMDDSGHMSPVLRAPSVAPKYADGRLVCFYGLLTGSSGQTITLPGGLTSELAYTAGPSLYIGDKAIASSSATGNFDATTAVTGKAQWGVQVLLKASGASTVTQAAAFINEGGVYQSPTTAAPTSPVTVNLKRLGAQTGDLVALAIYTQASSLTGPSGWTQQQSSTDGALFTHVQAAGDTTSPTFALGSSAPTAYEVVLLRNGIAADTHTLAVDTTGQNTATSSTTVSSSNLTPAGTTDFLALFVGSKQSTGGIWSVSAGPTRDTYNSGGNANAFAWENPAANPSGTFTWTNGNSQATATAWTLLAALQAALNVTLTGTHATAKAGALAPSSAIGAPGDHATAKTGTVATNLTVALTGAHATAKVGEPTPAAIIGAPGEHATAQAGAPTPTIAIAAPGDHATAKAGAVTAINGLFLALTGAHAASTAGSIASAATLGAPGAHATAKAGEPAPATTLGAPGAHATAKAGEPAVSTTTTVTLTGGRATAKAGMPTPNLSASTSGVHAAAKVGEPVASTSVIVALAGAHAAAKVGAVSANGSLVLALVGYHAQAKAARVTPDITAAITGGHATALARTPALDNTHALPGHSAQAKAFVPAGDITVTLGGQRAAARAGTAAYGVANSAGLGAHAAATVGALGTTRVVALSGEKVTARAHALIAGDLSGEHVFVRTRVAAIHTLAPDSNVFAGTTNIVALALTPSAQVFVRVL